MSIPTARLLVVDDDENNRDMLARRLERRGYAVDLAVNGADALAKVRGHTYDLVLLDIMMPGISGLEVLRELRLTHPATLLPIIMATAKSEREDVVESLALGANDYVTKPLDFPVVAARVENALSHKRAVDRILALERDLAEQNRLLQENNARMRRDLDLAADMQQSLLPATGTRFPGLEFAWNYRPCDELGGDILNIFRLGADHVGMYLLDVSGHGVSAALLSVTLSRLLSPVAGQASIVEVATAEGLAPAAPSQVLEELNRRFQISPENEQYFTLVYGVFDRRSREMTYAVAGHPPGLHLAADGAVNELGMPAFPIGWVPGETYQQQTLMLSAGDRLLLYSDGITESMNTAGAEYGRGRLAEALVENARHPLDKALEKIRSSMESFCEECRIRDDVSLLALEVL